MSDAKTRALERDAAGGDDHARVQLLQARLRSGELTAERVRLAALLGDTAARTLESTPAAEAQSLDAWGGALTGFGLDVVARVSAALAGHCLLEWSAWTPGELEPGPQVKAAVEASFAAWDAILDTELSMDAFRLLEAADAGLDRASNHLASLEAEHGLMLTKAWTAHTAGSAACVAARTLLYALEAQRNQVPHGEAFERIELGPVLVAASRAKRDPAAIREAVAAALLPWALG